MLIRRISLLIIAITVAVCTPAAQITVGAARTSLYLPLLEGKKVAVLSNHTGMVDSIHTVDLLLRNGVDVDLILSPEHGFRGTAAEGEIVHNSADPATGIPVYSLYGRHKGGDKWSGMPNGIDVIICDMQDVGMRFYTYYITMVEAMEYAMRRGVEFMVFDRPNPLGMLVDGPTLDMRLRSGVGRLPIPVSHGLTLGELAKMAWGEGWLDGQTPDSRLSLTVIPCHGYTHSSRYELPVAPSPNLRTMQAVYLYPSLCFFEGTVMSMGRGTDSPFTMYGHPDMTGSGFTFVPRKAKSGYAPVLAGRVCHGVDLSGVSPDTLIARGIDLSYLIDAYTNPGMRAHRKKFFTSFIDKLFGTTAVRKMIEHGKSADEIKASWAEDVNNFMILRKPYLLYPL